MNFSEITFKIIEAADCPYYKLGEEFRLSDTAIFIPSNKPACVILVLDITEILLNKEGFEDFFKNSPYIFQCSGCTGSIRMTYKNDNLIKNNISAISNLLKDFSLFKNLDENDIHSLVPLLEIKKFDKDDIIIKKGEPGKNLFIILSGKVEVLIDDVTKLGFVGKGEVFGEISILVGTPATATVMVVEPLTVLLMYERDFKRFLKKYPSLQMYFARLLARRLAKTNIERLEDFEAGISGKLSEMHPSELFQVLNLNHKTGHLVLNVSNGSAYLAFREGELVYAKYGKKKGADAFFELLKEKNGRFKFTPGLTSEEIKLPEQGDFMWLLMEGLNRIDQGN